LGKLFSRGVAAAAALMLAAPAAAQNFSDSYTFLKAVKERDGSKVTSLVAQPGSIVLNTRDHGSGETALHLVVRDRDYNWTAFLLQKGARPDVLDKSGNSPLSLAAQLGWVEGAQLLVAGKAGVDFANTKGETPLILAVHRRDVPMVRLLLSLGADPNRADRIAGLSAIDYAKRDPRAATVLRLLQASLARAPAAAGPTP
jgi:ankyrin repeat protein